MNENRRVNREMKANGRENKGDRWENREMREKISEKEDESRVKRESIKEKVPEP